MIPVGELKVRLAELPHVARLGDLPEFHILSGLLDHNEMIEEICAATYAREPGLLVATHKRLLFVDDKARFSGGKAAVECLYHELNSVHVARRGVFAKLTAFTDNGNVPFDMLVPKRAVAMAAFLNWRVSDEAQIQYAEEAGMYGAADLYEEIERLEGAYEAGGISAENFKLRRDEIHAKAAKGGATDQHRLPSMDPRFMPPQPPTSMLRIMASLLSLAFLLISTPGFAKGDFGPAGGMVLFALSLHPWLYDYINSYFFLRIPGWGRVTIAFLMFILFAALVGPR